MNRIAIPLYPTRQGSPIYGQAASIFFGPTPPLDNESCEVAAVGSLYVQKDNDTASLHFLGAPGEWSQISPVPVVKMRRRAKKEPQG